MRADESTDGERPAHSLSSPRTSPVRRSQNVENTRLGRDGTRWDGEAGWDESSIAAASSTDSGRGQAVHAGGGRGMPDGGGGIPIPATPLSTDEHHRRRMNDVADSYRTAAGDAAVLSRKQIVARRDIKTTQYSFWCNNKLLAKQAEYRCPEKKQKQFHR